MLLRFDSSPFMDFVRVPRQFLLHSGYWPISLHGSPDLVIYYVRVQLDYVGVLS